MIVYSTILRTKELFTRDILLRTILANSNSDQVEHLIESLPDIGIKKVHPTNSLKDLTIAADEEKSITAVRYQIQKSTGSAFSREYVLDERNHLLFVQETVQGIHVYDACADVMTHCVPKSIHRMIVEDLLDPDSCFSVLNQPHLLTEQNADQIISLKNGKSICQLPIVCITPSIFGRYPISSEKTAHELAGLAHVVVLENRKVLTILNEADFDLLGYHGSVSILYPGDKCFSAFTFANKKQDHNVQLMHSVLAYTSKQSRQMVLSFEQVYETVLMKKALHGEKSCREAHLAQKVAERKHRQLLAHLDEETKRLNETAMEKALQEAEQIVSFYEEDIELLRDELYEKNLYLQGMEVENQRLRSHLDQGRIPLIYLGEEKEFYLGEIQDLLLSTLEDALEDIPAKSRKRDVITDILQSNNYRHISKDRNEQVKNLLKGYDGMSAKVRHGLEELGFRVEENNKHFKICYHGDNRYLVFFGTTPSDVRTGKNNASTLARIAY